MKEMESFVSAANYAIFPTNIFAVQFSRVEDGMGQDGPGFGLMEI